MNLSEFVQQLFNDIRDAAQIIAPIAAVIGFLGLGLIYMEHYRGLEERQSQSR